MRWINGVIVALVLFDNATLWAQNADSIWLANQEKRFAALEQRCNELQKQNDALQIEVATLRQSAHDLAVQTAATDSAIASVESRYGMRLDETETNVKNNEDRQQKSVLWGIVVAAFLAVAAEHNFGRLPTNIAIAAIYGVFFLAAGLLIYTGAGYKLTAESFKVFFNETTNMIQETVRETVANFFKNSIYATSIDVDQYAQEFAESFVFTVKAIFAVVFVAVLEFMGHFTTGFYIFTAKRTGYEIIVPLGGWMIEMSHISAIVYFIAEALFAVFYLLEVIGVGVDIPYIVMMNFVILLMPNMMFIAFQRSFRKRPGQTRQRRFPILLLLVLLFFAPFFLLLSLATVGAMEIYGEYRLKKLEEMKKNDDNDFDDFNNHDDSDGNDNFN